MKNEELVLQYQTSQDKAERQALLADLYEQNIGLIGKVVSMYSGLEEDEDLRQEGYFGIVNAADRWQPEGGATFATYAFRWIQQSIRRYIDDCGSCVRIPVGRREQILTFRKYCSDHEKMHGCEPSDRQLMLFLGVSREVLGEIRRADQMLEVASLSAPILSEEGDGELGDLISDPIDHFEDVENGIQQDQLVSAVWKAVDGLPVQERAVIRKRFGEQKTLKETGADLGFSGTRAREIQASALRKLRRKKSGLDAFLDQRTQYYKKADFHHTFTSTVEAAVIRRERLREIYEQK